MGNFNIYKNENKSHEKARELRKENGIPDEGTEQVHRSGDFNPIKSSPNSEKYDGSDVDNEEFIKEQSDKYTKPYVPIEDVAEIEDDAMLGVDEETGYKDPIFSEDGDEAEATQEAIAKEKYINKYNLEHAGQYKIRTKSAGKLDPNNTERYTIDYDGPALIYNNDENNPHNEEPKKPRAPRALESKKVLEDKEKAA